MKILKLKVLTTDNQKITARVIEDGGETWVSGKFLGRLYIASVISGNEEMQVEGYRYLSLSFIRQENPVVADSIVARLKELKKMV